MGIHLSPQIIYKKKKRIFQIFNCLFYQRWQFKIQYLETRLLFKRSLVPFRLCFLWGLWFKAKWAAIIMSENFIAKLLFSISVKKINEVFLDVCWDASTWAKITILWFWTKQVSDKNVCYTSIIQNLFF